MSLQYAIMGLLSYKPMSGYDLKNVFDKSINFFWSAQLSQIYRDLGNLEAKGYVSAIVEAQEKRPDRKVYSITAEGRQSFQQWLEKFPPNLTVPLRDEFVVHVFFGSQISTEELQYQFRKLIKEQNEIIASYQLIEIAIEEYSQALASPEESLYWRLTLKRGFIMAEASIRWAEQCIEVLNMHISKQG